MDVSLRVRQHIVQQQGLISGQRLVGQRAGGHLPPQPQQDTAQGAGHGEGRPHQHGQHGAAADDDARGETARRVAAPQLRAEGLLPGA